MADIFEEVDEEVKRDKQLALWQRYGKLAVAGMVLVVGITAGIVGWREYQQVKSLEDSAKFEAAASQAAKDDGKTAAAAFEALAKNSGTGYETLARLRAAAIELNAGRTAEAAAFYDQVAKDGNAEPGLRDLATVLYVTASLETGKPDDLQARLQPLLAKDQAWRHSARELSALILLRAGDTAGARKMLDLIKDDRGAPPSIRRRATELLAVTEG